MKERQNKSRQHPTDTQGAIKKQNSTAAEKENDSETEGSYVLTDVDSVPTEKTFKEATTNFFRSWGNILSFVGILVGVIIAYANFNNDISNAQNDISELKVDSKLNQASIVDIEKESIRFKSTVEFLRDDVNNIQTDVNKLEDKIQGVKIQQALKK